MDKTTPVKHDHNTDVQRNMITKQMDKTPMKHDYNTDGKISNGET
jgi:hypothetical protein